MRFRIQHWCPACKRFVFVCEHWIAAFLLVLPLWLLPVAAMAQGTCPSPGCPSPNYDNLTLGSPTGGSGLPLGSLNVKGGLYQNGVLYNLNGTPPAGATTQVQSNQSGSFYGDTGFTYSPGSGLVSTSQMVLGGATGGAEGAGTLNATGLFINGAAVSAGGTPGGSDTNIQINQAGVFGGDSTFTFNATTKQVGIAGGTGGVGALAVGTAGTGSGLLLGGSNTTTALISGTASGSNANIGLEPKGTGSINVINPGGGGNILQVFGSTSAITDSLNIIPTTTSAQMLIRTANSQGIDFSNFPMQIGRAPYVVSGAIGLTPNEILFVNGTLEGQPSDILANGSAPDNHSITLGTSGSPYSCIQCNYQFGFKTGVSTNSIVSGFSAQFLNQQNGAPGQWPAWVTATQYGLPGNGTLPAVVTNGGYYYYVTIAGTSAGSTGPTCLPGNTCSDGGVTWKGYDLAANQTYLGALADNAQLGFNAGGTISGGIGVGFGFNSNIKLTPGATFIQGAASGEFDTQVQTGASTFTALGVQIVRQGTVQAAYSDVAVRIGGGFTAQWLTGFQIGNAIDPYGSFLRFGGSSAESGATLGTVPYTIGTAFDLNDLVVNGVCNAGVVTPVSFTGSIASSGVMTTTGSPSLSVGQYIYKYAGGANTPVGNTHITGGSGNSWTTAPTLQTITSTTLVAGGAYGFGQLGCPQSGGAGHRYMATRVGTGIIGNGDIYVGDGVLHAITGGMLIDSFNQKMTATTLAANSDGTFWTTGDLAEDPCGDQGTVTASAGAVSAVTITLAGYAEAGSTGECPASGGNIYWRPKFQATPNGTTGENAFQTPFSVPLTSYTWTQGTLLQFGGVAKLATFGTATSVPLHLASAQTTAPALTSCGTGSPTIVGSDTAGTITMGTSATGCIATFNVSYTSAPHCTVTWRATPLLSQSYVVAAATITLTQTSASGNLVDYVCVAPAGG